MLRLPDHGHEFHCDGAAGGWEVWSCARCRKTYIPSVFPPGFLWPEILGRIPGRIGARWRCKG